MKFLKTGCVALALLATLLSTPAGAAKNVRPNWEAEPSYKTLELSADFSDDPRSVRIDAGGDKSAETVGENCAGYINFDAPDVDINYENDRRPGSSAGTDQLSVYVKSDSDTSLVIFTPDRRWICSDDISSSNHNPSITLRDPKAGNYNVWVGNVKSDETAKATLYVSEVEKQ